MVTLALLLSGSFEKEYARRFNLDRDSYLENYRNDWSWDYVIGLKNVGIDSVIYIVSQKYSGLYNTKDGFKVRFLPLKKWYRLASILRFPPRRMKIGTYFQDLVHTTAFKDSLFYSLEEDKVDLLYIQEYWTTRFDLLVDNVNVPVLGADHGGSDKLAIKFFKQKSLPQAYRIQCQSIEEVEKVGSYGGQPFLLTNSVDTDFFCPSTLKDSQLDKTILIVARLYDKQKRISDLIRALQYLDESWNLEIVGTGFDLKYLQSLAANLNVSQRIRFLGFISDKSELRTKYRQCSIFTLPSAWEAVALVALEAMSCETAIVASDIKTFKSLVIHEKNGIRVPVGNPQTLAKGILKCYENRDRYGRAARQSVMESYSQKQVFSKLAKIVNSCSTLKKVENSLCRSVESHKV